MIAIVGVGVALAGCGGGSLEADPTPIEQGTVIRPQQYLADSSAATDAIADFMSGVEALGTEPTPAELRAAAPLLRDPLIATKEYSARLGSARLDDARLEAQREDVSAALAPLVVAMEQFADALERGDRRSAASSSARLADRADALRRAALPS